jgi:hypothetical protein
MIASRSKPSPSMAVAVVALVMAMTGGAYAAGATSAKSHKHKKPPTFAQKVLTVVNAHRSQLIGPAGATGGTGTTGTTGTPGPANMITYNATTSVTGTGGATGAGVIVLATVGPFAVVGKCTTYMSSAVAQTYIRATQDGSAVRNQGNGDDEDPFGPTTDTTDDQRGGTDVLGDDPIGDYAEGAPGSPDIAETDDGWTTVLSGDQQTRLLIDPVNASYVGGSSSPACTFYGSIVEAQ